MKTQTEKLIAYLKYGEEPLVNKSDQCQPDLTRDQVNRKVLVSLKSRQSSQSINQSQENNGADD